MINQDLNFQLNGLKQFLGHDVGLPDPDTL